MADIVYSACYGGFGLSHEAEMLYQTLSGREYPGDFDVKRDDEHLVAVVHRLGVNANGEFANLKIRNIPKGGKWRVDEYDGNERVMTPDDYEWETAA